MKDHRDTRYAWFVAGLLAVAYAVAFVDRQVLNLLVDPIKTDLGLSDTRISLLQGFAFVFAYVAMGPVFGRLADRGNRRNLLIAGIALWSGFTVLCGFSQGFWSLFTARAGIGYLRILTFILVIAAVVQFTEMFIKKSSPGLYQSLGIYLPLITTNCAVLGVALLNVEQKFSLFKSLLYGFGSALGFTIVLLIFAGLRERIALARVPGAFSGAPISFITISLLALAFMGFSGLSV